MGGSTQEGRAGGTVTFLFSDIEGSTALLREFGDRYGTLVADHHELLRQAFETRGGVVVDTEGDGAFVAFTQARNAVAAALDAQLALSRHNWPSGAAVRVRMGLHAGDALWSGDGYVGMAVHRAARVCAAAHGRQVLLSELTRHLVLDALPEGAWLLDLGTHRLRDFDEPQHVYQLCHDDLHSSFPPIRSLEATTSRQRVVMATSANEAPRGESVMTRLFLKAAEQDRTSLLSDENTLYLSLPDAARALQCAVRYLGHLQRRERAGGSAAPGARVSIAALGPSGQSGAARIAKRLCAQARAGEIVVSPEVAAALRALLGEDTPPLTPRGSPEGGLPVICVEWTVPPTPPLPPALSLDATAFVGRERELTMLQSAWARAEDGDFQLVFVGESPESGRHGSPPN